MKAEGVFRTSFAKAIEEFLSTVNKPKKASITTGVIELDGLVGGGFPQGSVVVLLGESGAGKSALLRNVAIRASTERHVLYVPIQDGGVQSAVRKLLALEAGMRNAAFDGEVSPSTRLAAIDAGDRLKETHDLSVYVEDGLMMPMLCEAVAKDFSGFSDAAEDLDGYEGLVLVDSLSMLADGQDVRPAICAMKSIVYGSQIALVVAAAGTQADINNYADADLVIFAEAGKGTSQRHDINLAVLRDSGGATVGSTAKVSFNRETMTVE